MTVRDLPISKKVARVEMRLVKGGIRELHWHVGSEWAYMTSGSARITAVDSNGRAFVDDVSEGDLWLFPGGIPHSIQGLGPDGCQFLLVFNDGNIDELPGPEKKNSGAVLNVFNPLQWCFNRLIPARSPHSEVNVSPRMEVPDQGFISSK